MIKPAPQTFLALIACAAMVSVGCGNDDAYEEFPNAAEFAKIKGLRLENATPPPREASR